MQSRAEIALGIDEEVRTDHDVVARLDPVQHLDPIIAVDAKPKKTPNLRRLRNIRGNPQVAVLADHYDDDWTGLWWVRADGRAAIVEDSQQMAGPIALLAGRYRQYRESPPPGPVIDITVERWTGWAAAPPGPCP